MWFLIRIAKNNFFHRSRIFTLFKIILKLHIYSQIIEKAWYYNPGGRKSNTTKKEEKRITKKYAAEAYRHVAKPRVRNSFLFYFA